MGKCFEEKMAEKNSKDNIFEIEKLYSESGIYIIYNKKTAYIGQAKDMKECVSI